MRKKIIIILCIIGIFVTGCGNRVDSNNDNNKKKNSEAVYVTIDGERFELHSREDLMGIHYRENYVDFNTDAVGNVRLMRYTKGGKFLFEVRVVYDENKTFAEAKELLNEYTEMNRTINGINYAYYEYKTDDNMDSHVYLYEYNNVVYMVVFILGEDAGNIEKVFMNNVTFS